MIDRDTLEMYVAWRENRLIADPDVSVEAFVWEMTAEMNALRVSDALAVIEAPVRDDGLLDQIYAILTVDRPYGEVEPPRRTLIYATPDFEYEGEDA